MSAPKYLDLTLLSTPKHPKSGKAKKSAKKRVSPILRSTARTNALSMFDDALGESGGVESERDRAREREMEVENRRVLEIDTRRVQLISPPPEETLSLRRHSRLSSGGSSTPAPIRAAGKPPAASSSSSAATSNIPPPPLPTGETMPETRKSISPTTSKRKRTPQTPLAVHPPPQPQQANDDDAMQVSDSAPSAQFAVGGEGMQGEATPNPKPRKMRHVRSLSVESPTKARRATRPPGSSNLGEAVSYEDIGEDNEDDFITGPGPATPSRARASSASVCTPTATHSNTNTTTTTTTPTKSRRPLATVQSPYAKNPDADWLPPIPALALTSTSTRRMVMGAKGRRRSETPIPAYEPPTDVFTPPREVFVTPRVEGQGRRRSRTPGTGRKTKSKTGKSGLWVDTVKQELPDYVDLSKPMPPPSPSDDPLLLSGPPEPPVSSGVAESPLWRDVGPIHEDEEDEERYHTEEHQEDIGMDMEDNQYQDEGVSDVDADVDVLPPSSSDPPLDSEDRHDVGAFDFSVIDSPSSDEDSMMHIDPEDAAIAPVALFPFTSTSASDNNARPDNNANGDGGDGWSDSDEDEMGGAHARVEEEGEGEYTGRWQTWRVRTKMDPPSPATRARMELWGRPVSPFPERPFEEGGGVVTEKRSAEEERGVVLAERVVEEEQEHLDVEEEEEVRQMSLEPQLLSPEVDTRPLPDEHVEFGAEIQRSSSPVVDDGDVEVQPPLARAESLEETEESSDGDNDSGFVKITSSDPWAAARAAAILKQHDYECYTKPKKQRRHSIVNDLARESRRRDLSSSGISKSKLKSTRTTTFTSTSTSTSRLRKSAMHVSVIGENVFIPGTPPTTLPALLQEAEKEVEKSFSHYGHGDFEVHETPSKAWAARASLDGTRQRDMFKTPLPNRSFSTSSSSVAMSTTTTANDPKLEATPMPLPKPVYNSTTGARVWTKEEWRFLDACFTDQRLDLAELMEGYESGAMAPVEMVRMEDVVARFVGLLGGEDVLAAWGEDWEREDLLERARALLKKQRAGRGARPSTPRAGFIFSPSTSRLDFNFTPSQGTKDTPNLLRPSMDVPDFTPLLNRRAAPHPRKSKSTSETTSITSASTINNTASNTPSTFSLPSHAALPLPVTENAPFSALDATEGENGHSQRRMPRSLLAPRYSHLMEEAVRIGQEGNFRIDPSTSVAHDVETHDASQGIDEQKQDEHEENEHHNNLHTPAISHTKAPQPSSTLTTRVKGFFTSYLPTLSSKPATRSTTTKSQIPRRGLPLPPPSVLSRQRPPIATPLKPPVPRARPPRELVSLHPAPKPADNGAKSALLRAKEVKRLVDLVKVDPPVEKPVVDRTAIRARRSSGGSVKDLVKGFEELERSVAGSERSVRMGVGRTKSGNELRARWKATQPDERPRWK